MNPEKGGRNKQNGRNQGQGRGRARGGGRGPGGSGDPSDPAAALAEGKGGGRGGRGEGTWRRNDRNRGNEDNESGGRGRGGRGGHEGRGGRHGQGQQGQGQGQGRGRGGGRDGSFQQQHGFRSGQQQYQQHHQQQHQQQQHNSAPYQHERDSSQVSNDILRFWRQLHKNLQASGKQPFSTSDPRDLELWNCCWRVAESSGGGGRECTVDSLMKVYLTLPDTAAIHPPAASVVAALIQQAEAWGHTGATAAALDTLTQVVKDRLMSAASLATITSHDTELGKQAEQLKKAVTATVLRARLAHKDMDDPQLLCVQAAINGLFPAFVEAVKGAVQEAACALSGATAGGSGAETGEANAVVPVWLQWSARPTVGWLMSADWQRDVPSLKEMYALGVPEYAETLLRIWTVLTFYWGSVAVWPACKVSSVRNGAEQRCLEPLLCLASQRGAAGATCGQEIMVAGRQTLCGKPALWCCRRHVQQLALCQGCLQKRQDLVAGPPTVAGRVNFNASTDIYDALVSREEARKEGTVLHLTGVRSRRPPQVDPNWHTTYRLQCSGLVAVVPLSMKGEGLRRDCRVYWGEIVNSVARKAGGAPPPPESRCRQQGQVAVRLLGRGDLPSMSAEAEVARDAQVAIIDLRVFVPEVISVLATFANPQFAAHLQAIPFARRLIGLEQSPPLLRLANPEVGNEVGSYLWEALRKSEIHCIQMLSDADRADVYRDIMKLAPMKTLYGTQLEAFATALSSALHCTQGPPGTGKSYVGVCVILALMVLRRKMQQNKIPVGPILMLSYKNHALEEFLCDVLRGAPHLRPGQLVRCGKVDAPELQDYSERNSADERAAEAELHRCVVVQRDARSAVKLWSDLARAQDFGVEGGGLPQVLKAMELLVRLYADCGEPSLDGGSQHAVGEEDDAESTQTTGRPIEDLLPDVVASSALRLEDCSTLECYEDVFLEWIEAASHWREVFTPKNFSGEGKGLVPALLVRWLRGENPPPRCQAVSCLQYAVRGHAYCTTHKCAAAGCGDLCDTSTGLPFCDKHRCSCLGAEGPCRRQRLGVGEYCETHVCPGCVMAAAHQPNYYVDKKLAGGGGACAQHRCQVRKCTGLMLAPALYCADHVCVQCVEVGEFNGEPRLGAHTVLCVDHACLVERCPQRRLTTVAEAEYCEAHTCRLCSDAVNCLSEIARKALLCADHSCSYADYPCCQPVLEANGLLCHFCDAHTCSVCVAANAPNLNSPVLEDYPRNVCAAHALPPHPPDAEQQAAALEYTGTCHGITKKGANCKAKCPEEGQLFCLAHAAQGEPVDEPVAQINAMDEREARVTASRRDCAAYLAALRQDEETTLATQRLFVVARCTSPGCTLCGVAELSDIGTWRCSLHCSSPALASKPNAGVKPDPSTVPTTSAGPSTSAAPAVGGAKDTTKNAPAPAAAPKPAPLPPPASTPTSAEPDDYELVEDFDDAAPLRTDAVGGMLDADERDVDDGYDFSLPMSGIKADIAQPGLVESNPERADNAVEIGEDEEAGNDDQRRLQDIGAVESDDDDEEEEVEEEDPESAHPADCDAADPFGAALDEAAAWSWSWSKERRHDAASQLLRYMSRQLGLLRQEWESVVDAARRRKAEAGAAILKNATIVGATVVGISKRLDKIRAAEPFAAVVEEACEVMEPTLISVLAVRSLQKLELVGDHRQLPAFVQQCWYELTASMPSIKTSMFERLIGDANWERTAGGRAQGRRGAEESGVHRVPFSVLDEQRRMRTNIADLTRPHYHDVTAITDHGKTRTQQLGDYLVGREGREFKAQLTALKEHRLIASPQCRATIPGLPTNIFFWDLPGNKESRPIAGLSACNEAEANAVVSLSRWLVDCGAPPSSITVITPYKGQKNLILRNLRTAKLVPEAVRRAPGQPMCRDDMSCITVSTVDTFQGDENDIIILSLVRVNPGNRFIELKNRFIVALSRARIATFVIGAVAAVTKGRAEGAAGPQHWMDFVEHLRSTPLTTGAAEGGDACRVGGALPICCPQHSASRANVTTCAAFPSKDHWNTFCHAVCTIRLPCEHPCGLMCHATSPAAHTQPKKCATPMPRPCERHKEVPLLCGAIARIEPAERYEMAMQRFKCDVKVVHARLLCGHKVTLPCADDEAVTSRKAALPPCEVVVEDFVKACGHVIRKPKCFERQRYEQVAPVCSEVVDHTRPGCLCKMGMECSRSVAELNQPATIGRCLQNKCVRRPRCGHSLTAKCHITTPLTATWGRTSRGVSATFPADEREKLLVPWQPNFGPSEKDCCDGSIPDCAVKVNYKARCGHLFPDVLCHQAFTYALTLETGLPECRSDKEVACGLCNTRVEVPCWSSAHAPFLRDIFALGQAGDAASGKLTFTEGRLDAFSVAQQARVPNGLANIWKDLCIAEMRVQRPCGHVLEMSCKALFVALMQPRAQGTRLLKPCTERVERVLRCGHKVMVRCCDSLTVPEPGCKVVNTTAFTFPCGQHTVTPGTCAELLQLRAKGAGALCPTIVPSMLHRCKHLTHVPCHQASAAADRVGVGVCLSASTAVVTAGVDYCQPCLVAPPCQQMTQVKFPCGHTHAASCHSAFDWVENDFVDTPKCTAVVEMASPVCKHPLVVACWEAQILSRWVAWPEGLPPVEPVSRVGVDGKLESVIQLFEGTIKPAKLPQGITADRLRCAVPAVYVRQACDHIAATECSRAHHHTVPSCTEQVQVACEKGDCCHVRKIPCKTFTAEKESGKAEPCRNVVSRPCQVCHINHVDIECFKVDVRCNRKVEADLPCAHKATWLCGADADPRSRPSSADYCVPCQLPQWERYIDTIDAFSRQELRAGLFAAAKKTIKDTLENAVTVIHQREMPFESELHCGARRRIAQCLRDALNQGTFPAAQTCVPPRCAFMSAEDICPGGQYQLVVCTVDAHWKDTADAPVRARYSTLTTTPFGQGAAFQPFTEHFLNEVFNAKRGAADSDAVHLCIGVLYSHHTFVAAERFAVGAGKRTNADCTVQAQRALGYDAVSYAPAAGVPQLITWEAGAAVPLLLATVEQKATCCICMDSCSVTGGYTCTGEKKKLCGQFTCWECMTHSYGAAAKADAIKGTVTDKGDLVCSSPRCKCPINIARLQQVGAPAPAAVLEAQQNLRIQIVKDKEVQAALEAQKRQIEAEYARIEAIKDQDEKAAAKLRLKIVDEVLTLRCPRCKTAFFDFDGCCALTCGVKTCNAGFCAWCQHDCGADAHGHVPQCPDNGNGRNVYASAEQIKAGQARRRTRLAREMVQRAELTARARDMLRASLQRDLADLGIRVDDVFPQQQQRAPAPAPAPAQPRGFGFW